MKMMKEDDKRKTSVCVKEREGGSDGCGVVLCFFGRVMTRQAAIWLQ